MVLLAEYTDALAPAREAFQEAHIAAQRAALAAEARKVFTRFATSPDYREGSREVYREVFGSDPGPATHPGGCMCEPCLDRRYHPDDCRCDSCDSGHPEGCQCGCGAGHVDGCRCDSCDQGDPDDCRCDYCLDDRPHVYECQCESCLDG